MQQISAIAFTAAGVFTYATNTASGCAARARRTSSVSVSVNIRHVASAAGSSVTFSGERIFAVSAMNRTPQNTITSASVRAACRDKPNESPVKSAISWISSG